MSRRGRQEAGRTEAGRTGRWTGGPASGVFVCLDFFCDNLDAADSTVFTEFLRPLNSGACFAGQCDWRLPTRDELQTILADPFTGFFEGGCTTPSCIDAIFGPTQATGYWSATSVAGAPGTAWYVGFDVANVHSIIKPDAAYVRGVRGGL